MLSWQFLFAVIFFATLFAVFIPLTWSQHRQLKRGERKASLRVGTPARVKVHDLRVTVKEERVA